MSFEQIWERAHEFQFSTEDDVPLCPFAQQFVEWARELSSKVRAKPDLVTINQAKILLIDKYFEWRGIVPKSHRNRIGPGGHQCIFHVFEMTYQGLRAIELSLTPPMLFIPPPPPAPTPYIPPPPPPPPQIAGVFIGELDDE